MVIKATDNPNGCLSARLFGAASLSAVDGPGSRVVLFFQGCAAHCEWCHSPHSIPPTSPLLYRNSVCCMCGRCLQVCPFGVHRFSDGEHQLNRSACKRCGRCVQACPHSSANKETGALYLPTKRIALPELVAQLLPHLAIADGITLSGGEALLQTKAAVSLLAACKAHHIHTAVETSGLLKTDCYAAALPYVDAWLFGFRVLTAKNGEYATGKIMSSLECIKKSHARIMPRIPLIPGVTDITKTLDKIHALLLFAGTREIWLNPWNRFFTHYYSLSGIAPVFPVPSDLQIAQCERKTAAFFNQRGYKVNINK